MQIRDPVLELVLDSYMSWIDQGQNTMSLFRD